MRAGQTPNPRRSFFCGRTLKGRRIPAFCADCQCTPLVTVLRLQRFIATLAPHLLTAETALTKERPVRVPNDCANDSGPNDSAARQFLANALGSIGKIP